MGQINPVRHPLLYRVSQGARWVGQDDYPAVEGWADEHERWLAFLNTAGQYQRFLPRLQDQAKKRNETLAEICAAYFLEKYAGLRVVVWEPPSRGGSTGEFLVSLGALGQMFVEVKSPGWEREVFEAERPRSSRLRQPKYLEEKPRGIAPYESIRIAVAKAYRQIPNSISTLLIIVDDFFCPLSAAPDWVEEALYRPRACVEGLRGFLTEDGPFVGRQYTRLGAVATLNAELWGRVRYSFNVFPNPNALHSSAVPPRVFSGFPIYEGKVWRSETRWITNVWRALRGAVGGMLDG